MPSLRRITLFTVALTHAAIHAAELEPAVPDFRPFTIGLDAGTLGPGVSGVWRFSDHFGVRLGVHAFSYSYDGDIEDISFDTDLRLSSQSLGLDWHPWKGSSFRITAGVMLNQMDLKGSAQGDPTATVEIDGTTYTYAQAGTLHAKVAPDDVNFYLGIGGNLYLGSQRRWSIGAELGLVYVGEYDIRLNATGSDPAFAAAVAAGLRQVEQDARNAAEDFPFYPVLQISVNYSF